MTDQIAKVRWPVPRQGTTRRIPVPCGSAGSWSAGSRSAGLRARAGMTVIELLLALVMLGVLASIASPMIDRNRFAVDSAVRSTNMILLGAQRLAIQRQHNIVIAFDTVAGIVRVHHDTNNDGVLDAGEITQSTRLEDGVRFGRGTATARAIGGAAVTFTRTQGGLPAVTFTRAGTASEIGGFYLTVPGGGTARAVEVERATGRTYRFGFANGNWYR